MVFGEFFTVMTEHRIAADLESDGWNTQIGYFFDLPDIELALRWAELGLDSIETLAR